MATAAAVPRKPVREVESSKVGYLFTPIKRGFVRDGHAARLSRLSPAGLIIVLGVQEALAESGGKPVKIDLPEMAQWAQESVRRVSDAAKELRKKGVLPWVRRGKSYAYSFDYNKLTELPERGPRKAPGAGVKKVAARLPANLPCPEQIPICPYVVEGGGDGSFLVTLSPPVGGARQGAPLFSPTVQNQQVTSKHRKSMSGDGRSGEKPNTGSPCPVSIDEAGRKNGKEHRKSMSGVPSGEQKAKMRPNAANSAAKHEADPWLALKKKVCGRIEAEVYNNLFAPARSLAYDGQTVRVSIPNEDSREWLQEEYGDLITKTLAEVGFAGVKVSFEVQTAEQLAAIASPPRPEPGMRERLEALVPLNKVGEPLPDHLWTRIEQKLGATPWPFLHDVITAKFAKIRSWAFVADHLAEDARKAWERAGGRKEDGQKEPNAYLDKNGKPVEWPDEWLTEFRG